MKIKYSIIGKLNTLSAKEMELFFFIVKKQDEKTGCVEGIYYRQVMKETGMCKQSFYNALRGLVKKGIITITRASRMDYDVCIPGNAFPDRNSYREGYVYLKRRAFVMDTFDRLKAHEKYLLLEFLKRTHESRSSWRIGVDEFYKKFQEILHVSKRVIRGYLHNLRLFFSIGKKNGMYYITYLHSVFKKVKIEKSDEIRYQEHLVRKECWRNHTACEEDVVADTAFLIRQYRNKSEGYEGTESTIRLLMQCIRSSVEGIRWKDRKLNVKYVHKLMRAALCAPESI